MSSPIRKLVFTALFAAIFIVMSAIKIPLGFTLVPISLQNFAIMLAGAFLGARLGLLSILSVIILTAIGLPLLNGEGGLAKILGPTGGFIWMFPISAMLVGLFSERLLRSHVMLRKPFILFCGLFATFLLFGSLISYLAGVPWYAYSANLSIQKALAGAMYPFLPGDTIKAFIAAAVVVAARAYIPQFSTPSQTPSQTTHNV